MARKKPNSREAQRLLRELAKNEVAQIQKDNPFRRQRNAGIRRLCDLGVKLVTIAEISGFSDTEVAEIRDMKQGFEGKRRPKAGHKEERGGRD